MIVATLYFSVLLSTQWTLTSAPLQAARSQFDSGNYAAAVKTLSTAIRENPQDAALHFWLARSYYETRDYDKAVASAETAVHLAPENAEYNRWLGRAYGGKAEQSQSFFLARKVKQAFEAAVRLAPRSIEARRDLMQYCVEAPWIVGGDKDKARQQIEAISKLDPVEGRLARGAYLRVEKQWKAAEAEYTGVLAQHPSRIDPYMEAADFFANRNDSTNLDRTLEAAASVEAHDPRLEYYRGISLILRQTQLSTAQQLLKAYLANVPERSDYPSHHSATEWLRRIDSNRSLENRD